MVFTDPPYNVAYEGKTAQRLTIANDALDSEFAGFLDQACHALLPVTKGAIYVCMSSPEVGTLKAAFEAGRSPTFTVKATAHDQAGTSVPLSITVQAKNP